MSTGWLAGAELGGAKGDTESDTPDHHRRVPVEIDADRNLVVLASYIALQIAEVDEVVIEESCIAIGGHPSHQEHIEIGTVVRDEVFLEP